MGPLKDERDASLIGAGKLMSNISARLEINRGGGFLVDRLQPHTVIHGPEGRTHSAELSFIHTWRPICEDQESRLSSEIYAALTVW